MELIYKKDALHAVLHNTGDAASINEPMKAKTVSRHGAYPPVLNKRCPKTHCYLNGGECRSTRHPEFALVNKMGALLMANEMGDLFL